MLFTQHNGLAHAAADQSEIEVLQNMACSIGPRVDGIAASLTLPQAMGAFSTAGAAGACGGRSQQAEQHTPTTMSRGLGADTPWYSPTITKTPTTTTTTTKTAYETFIAPLREMKIAAMDANAAATAPVSPAATPANPMATTYPAGTITAFDVTTNMWRVAVPSIASGLGIFGSTAPFTEIAPLPAPAPGATQVSVTQLQKQTGQLPIYKKWQFWAAAGGGALVLGTVTALLFRRKRAA
jgi:hypothetical protein